MDDKSALLNQLRIDRGSGPTSPQAGRSWLIAVLVVLALAAAVAAWLWLKPEAVPVHIAVAKATASSGAPTAVSMLDASGYVVARRQATVSAKITGKVVELDIEEGSKVEAGEVMARLDDTNLRAALNQSSAQLAYARASLDETSVNLANAQRDYDRKKGLFVEHYISVSDLDAAQTSLDGLRARLATGRGNVDVAQRAVEVAQRNLDDAVVRAPYSGVITVKAAQPGEIVSPISAGGGFTRTGIGTLVDMDSLEIEVDVNENFINRVEAGQKVGAKLNAYPDWQIPAHVIAVIPTADRSKGTVKVRIGLDVKDPKILPDMGVRVSFLAEIPKDGAKAAGGVILPANAVQTTGDSTGAVFIVHEDKVERRAVRLGASTGEGLTILSGLSGGERIAVGDFTQLKDGASIRVEQ